MDEFCTTIEERLSRIIDLFETSKITDCLQLLANLQDASSALGFRSLFSAATETHEAIAASQAADSRVITASLASNMQKAKEAWAAARALYIPLNFPPLLPTFRCLSGPRQRMCTTALQ